MKGSSRHLPVPMAPMDDSFDRSSMVDYPRGVNFDNSEEMVKCNDCNVWVHTRFVKEEASFTYDRCKAKKLRPPPPSRVHSLAATNIEQIEVTQLLAEHPTKGDLPTPLDS